IVRAACEEYHLARADLGHLRDSWIRRIQDGVAVTRNRADDYLLNVGKFVQSLDSPQAEMVSLADIRDNRDITAVKAKPFAKNPAAGSLLHGCLHARIEQHRARTLRAAAIARFGAPAIQKDAIGAGHAYIKTRFSQNVRQQARRGRFSIDASDCRDRNTTR